MIDFDAYRDLFDGLEHQQAVQADLAVAPDLAAMRAVLEGGFTAALPLFDDLAADLTERYGDESRFTGNLRAALTAAPHGDVFARFLPEEQVWVWADARDAEPGAWRPFEDGAVARDATGGSISVEEEAGEIYLAVLQELGELEPEDQGVIWSQVCRRVGEEQAVWTPDRGQAVTREVITAYRAAAARQDEELEAAVADLVAALDSFETGVSERTGL